MVDFYDSIDSVFGDEEEEDQSFSSPVTTPPITDSIDSVFDMAPVEPERRTGEGVGGFFGDVAAGTAGGLVRGTEMVAQSAEWFLPENMDEGAGQAADFLKGIREENPMWFGESRVSEASRQDSAWNVRGWFYGGMESLGMLAPGLAAGVASGGLGTAVVASQFWGSTAQEAYDEAVSNERQGIGEKLTEQEKLVYANLRGFWEGGIEALQSRIPFAKFGKWLPKNVQGNIIRGAIKQPGNAAVNSIKSLAKTMGIEIATELGQEYAGQKTAFEYGQSKVDPRWEDIEGVIGPTIIMSGILGISGQASEGASRKKLHDALTGTDVAPVTRRAAVKAMHDRLKDTDAELAQMWMDWAVPLLEENKPIALPLDEEVRTDAVADADAAKSALEQEIDAKGVETAQKRGEIDARAAASTERAAEGLAEPVVAGEPNAEGVIEPEVQEAPHTVESLDAAIGNMEKLLESRPNSPAAVQVKENLETAKAQRAQLLEAEVAAEEAPVAEEAPAAEEAPVAEEAPAAEELGEGVAKPDDMDQGTYDTVVQKAREVMTKYNGVHTVGVGDEGVVLEDNLGPAAKKLYDAETKRLASVRKAERAAKALPSGDYAHAAEQVSGLKVRSEVPNTDSIAASFEDHETLDGVRDVPFSEFGGPGRITPRIEKLAEEIKSSGEINPLIVAVDKDGPYILEGAHRFEALLLLGHKTFPAVVVRDLDEGEAPVTQAPATPSTQKAKQPKAKQPKAKQPKAKQPKAAPAKPQVPEKPAPAATETPQVPAEEVEQAPVHEGIQMIRKVLGEEAVEEVETNAPQAKTIRNVAEKFGKKVVFFRGSEKANGFYHPSIPDTVFVNLDADANPLMITFGHELLHALKGDNLDLYIKLARQLTGKTRNFRRWVDSQNKALVREGLSEMSDAELLEELLADFTGEQFFDPAFWRDLLKKDVVLFEKLSELFQMIYEQMKQFAPATNKHFKEIKAARAALVGVFEEYAAAQAAEQQAPPVVEEAAPKLSMREGSVAQVSVVGVIQDADLDDRVSATWTSKRTKKEIRTAAYPDGRTKAVLAWVNPLSFIEATTNSQEEIDAIKERAGDLDAEKLAEEYQTPFLYVHEVPQYSERSKENWRRMGKETPSIAKTEEELNAVDYKITGHEGRHRMAGLAAAGHGRIPIIIDFQEPEIRQYEAKGKRIGNQYSRWGTGITPQAMIPLVPENEELINEVMTKPSVTRRGVKFSMKESQGIAGYLARKGVGMLTSVEIIEASWQNPTKEFEIEGEMKTAAEIQSEYASQIKFSLKPQKVSQSSLGLYSALNEAVKDIDTKQMPAIHWLARLRKTQGVKADELQWTGVEEWLGAQEGKISKDDLLAFIEANGVQVEEVVLGGEIHQELFDEREVANAKLTTLQEDVLEGFFDAGATGTKARNAMHLLMKENFDIDNSLAAKLVERTSGVEYFDKKLFIELRKADLSWREAQRDIDDARGGSTKYSEYTLPGGENYREVLLTLPRKPMSLEEYAEAYKKMVPGIDEATIKERYPDYLSDPGQDLSGTPFKSAHYDQPNILAHIRLNDRIGPNGEKILFIEELQSDWAQEGRKKGFAAPKGDIVTPNDEQVREFFGLDEGIRADDMEGYREEMMEHPSFNAPVRGVPTAPFVGSTSKWLDLALKRVLRLAAEGGYDSVSWTPGEVQADRYDLSKQVDSIDWLTRDGKTFDIAVMKDGAEVEEARQTGLTPNDLEGIVGKEIAQRIADQTGRKATIRGETIGTLSGLDLKVGGEGMKAFYDSIVPKAMGKLIKKLDKSAKVGVGSIQLINRNELADDADLIQEGRYGDGTYYVEYQGEVHEFDTIEESDAYADSIRSSTKDVLVAPVTKDLSDKVMGGQTLFSRKTPEEVASEVFKTADEAADTFTGRIARAFGIALTAEGRATLGDKLDTARTFLVDRYGPINKNLGDHVYKLHRLLNNSAATVGTFLQHGKLSWQDNALTVKTQGEGFVPWFQGLGEEGHKFLYWVAAKRAELLDKEDRENWFNAEQRQVFFDDANKRDMTEKYEEWNKTLQGFNKNVVDIGIQSGLIDPEARGRWMTHYYLPFFRMLENEDTSEEFIKGPTTSKKYITSGIKTLTGGEALIGDPLENLMQNWTHIIAESQRQIARQAAAELMINSGMGKEMTKGQLIKVLGVNSVFGVRNLNEDGTIAWAEFAEMDRKEVLAFIDKENRKRKKDNKLQLIERQTLRTANKEEGKVMSFMRNGKPVYVKVDDMELYQALTQVESRNLDFAPIKAASWFKRVLTYGATFGVGFRIANLLRDTLHSAVVSKSFFPFVDSARGIMQVMRGSQDYVELMASGGGFSQGYLDSADPEKLSKNIKDLANKRGIARDISASRHTLNTVKKLHDFWQWIGHATEMAARVQLYTNLKSKGDGHMEAAFEARDLLDFALTGSGESVRVLTATIPFLNARMQGLDRLARGARDNPAAFVAKGAMVAAASLAIWAKWRDDDRYKELEDWDKWQYHHLWIGEDHIRIPKAFEVGAIFGTLFEATAETMTDEEEFGYWLDMVGHTGRSTFAIGIPQVVSPMVELWANKSTFTGRQIEPEWMRKLSQGARANPWTSESMKEIGKLTGISPVKLQTAIRGYTATIGTGVLTIADAILETRDDVVTPKKMAHEYLGLDRFISSRVKNTKYATRYHEFAQEATQLASTIEMYKTMRNYKMVTKLAAETPDFQARKKIVSKVNRKLASVRQQEKMVWSDLTVTRAKKRERLDDLREQKNDIYRAAYRQIKHQGL